MPGSPGTSRWLASHPRVPLRRPAGRRRPARARAGLVHEVDERLAGPPEAGQAHELVHLDGSRLLDSAHLNPSGRADLSPERRPRPAALASGRAPSPHLSWHGFVPGGSVGSLTCCSAGTRSSGPSPGCSTVPALAAAACSPSLASLASASRRCSATPRSRRPGCACSGPAGCSRRPRSRSPACSSFCGRRCRGSSGSRIRRPRRWRAPSHSGRSRARRADSRWARRPSACSPPMPRMHRSPCWWMTRTGSTGRAGMPCCSRSAAWWPIRSRSCWPCGRASRRS